MRRSLTFIALAIVGLVVGGGLLLATRGGDDGEPAAADNSGLEVRTLSAGDIDIRIEPRQLDDRGAAFAVILDTHSTELSMDVAAAEFEVDGTSWLVAGWDGDGPGGHHREGELRFDAAGPAIGTARLVLTDFPEPVEVSWEVGS